MFALFQRFLRSNSGNYSVMFGLMAIPLIGLGGAALDYTRAATVRANLLAAADSASVGAIGQSSAAMTAAATMLLDGPIPAGVTDATNIFNDDKRLPPDVTVKTLSVSVTKSGQNITSTVSVTATVPMHFLPLVGTSSVDVSTTSTSTNSLPLYIDFYLLLDNTPSMGVGATPTDVATMVANTSDQCAFACHDLSNNNGYYQLAKNKGVTMRVDVLRQATQQLMDTANATEQYPNQFRMAIYTFGASATNLNTTMVQSLTASLTTAKVAASAIDVMTVPYQNYNNDQDTDFNAAMTAMNTTISTPGDGYSAVTPQKILFFVSDGVGDASVNGSRSIAPIDTSLCTTLKNRGIKIAALYTTYLPLPTNSFYMTYVNPFVNNIGPTMQSCASPGLYFEVSPTQGIADAMNALFQKAVAEAHITN